MNSYDEHLLFAVSKQPALFNPMRHDYKNSDSKMQAWEEVKQTLNTPESIERIRQRWKSIRDSYVKYLNKKDKSSSGPKIRPYKYEKHLKFLKPFLIASRDFNQSSFSPDDSLQQMDSAEQLVCVSQLPDDDQSSNSSMSSKKRKRNDVFFENSLSMPLHNDSYKLFQHMDDVDIFFLGLAQTMKKLRPLTMAKLKKQISNIISDAEIHELEEVD